MFKIREKVTEKEILDVFEKVNGLIKDSHIVYTSGRHGKDYVNKDAIYPYPVETSRLCLEIASHFKDKNIDTLILGCTHYPLLKEIIQAKVGKRVTLIDPAEQTALHLVEYLKQHPDVKQRLNKNNNHQYFFSDVAPHLAELAERWLGRKIKPQLHNIQ